MTEERNGKSLCENSMKMVVNIIKLSSFSVAKMSLGETGHPTLSKNRTPAADSDMVTEELLQPQFSGSQISEKLQRSSKPYLYVMQPGGGNESVIVHEGERDSDDIFDDFIRRIHERNRSNSHEATRLSPSILPPPPTLLSPLSGQKQSSSYISHLYR